ncbi:hypothetical protein [Chitinimonas sp. BJB300]|uniref:hypothetical protein n=1 Tax=Chitinimonas sp. BJB300 TaxID=1559339 RepID=UPI000C0E7786|nr:hypothetical protein [Chitinimonas sp. BJB300]PHV12870.1 hypothetical protein CSQ89_03505 [Chitinimonas sp. BJB300]TSJ86098.1 hypothetical protein FG002_016335 [Chitinimonas sp. BJB300]
MRVTEKVGFEQPPLMEREAHQRRDAWSRELEQASAGLLSGMNAVLRKQAAPDEKPMATQTAFQAAAVQATSSSSLGAVTCRPMPDAMRAYASPAQTEYAEIDLTPADEPSDTGAASALPYSTPNAAALTPAFSAAPVFNHMGRGQSGHDATPIVPGYNQHPMEVAAPLLSLQPSSSLVRSLTAPTSTLTAARTPESKTFNTGETWQARNVHMTQDEQGHVQVWLRDAQMNTALRAVLLQQLRQELGGAGLQLGSLMVNGKPVWREQDQTRSVPGQAGAAAQLQTDEPASGYFTYSTRSQRQR